MRVLVFGDSITQGFWDAEGGWVDRLRRHYDELQLADFGKDQPTIFNLGISGDTSRGVLARAEAEVSARTWQHELPMVIVQIGVNDSCAAPHDPMVSIEEYRANLAQLIATLRPRSSAIIFVGLSACDEAKTLPVDWGEYYYANTRIKAYQDQMEAAASAAGISFVPVFDEFLSAMHTRNLLADGLHPSSDGHAAIFDIVRPQLLSLIEGSRR